MNSLSGGNQAPISLTQFGMREARVAAVFRDFLFLIYLFCPFNKDVLDFGANFVVVVGLGDKMTSPTQGFLSSFAEIKIKILINESGLLLLDNERLKKSKSNIS